MVGCSWWRGEWRGGVAKILEGMAIAVVALLVFCYFVKQNIDIIGDVVTPNVRSLPSKVKISKNGKLY